LALTASCAANWRIDGSLHTGDSAPRSTSSRSRSSIWSMSGVGDERSIGEHRFSLDCGDQVELDRRALWQLEHTDRRAGMRTGRTEHRAGTSDGRIGHFALLREVVQCKRTNTVMRSTWLERIRLPSDLAQQRQRTHRADARASCASASDTSAPTRPTTTTGRRPAAAGR
jgi:hypothetical protein